MNAIENMLMAKIDKAIEREFRNHVEKEGGMIVGAEKLQIALTRALIGVFGSLAEPEHPGWKIVRKSGKEMKVRGNARGFFGFEATHIRTGYVEEIEPSSGGDVPFGMVEIILTQLDEIIAKFGSMENFRKAGNERYIISVETNETHMRR